MQGKRDTIIEIGPGEPSPGTLRIQFETPTCLMRGKELLKELDFPTLFFHLHRRLVVLAALYGELVPSQNEEFAELCGLASEVRVVHSDIRPVKWKRDGSARYSMEGILGDLTFQGPVGAFLPLLRAVELTHLGKATSFGLGRTAVLMNCAGHK